MILTLRIEDSIVVPYIDGERITRVVGIDKSVSEHMITEDRCNGIYVFEGEFEIRDGWIYAK